MILPQINLFNGIKLCRRMIRKVSSHNFGRTNGDGHRLTLSIGLSWRQEGMEIELSQLIEAADRALYDAKRNGKNCLCHQDAHLPLRSNMKDPSVSHGRKRSMKAAKCG
jgi:diguanylate cyclase (GGDEF)-like protein